MIKGSNTMRLNTATVVDLVQQWLDREMKNSPVVSSVRGDTQAAVWELVITLAERKQEPSK